MTDEQMRIAIAEALGYTHVRIIKDIEGPPDAGIGHHPTKPHSVLDYLNDLNAMHEAESCFVGDASKAMTYAMHLLRACRLSIASEYDELNVDYCWHACHATARQRAKAFLKTLNLWKD